MRSLYHEYKNVYARKILCDQRGVENGLKALKSRIRNIEDKMELSSILIAREHAHAEVKSIFLGACLYDPAYPGLGEAWGDFEVWKEVI